MCPLKKHPKENPKNNINAHPVRSNAVSHQDDIQDLKLMVKTFK